MAPFLLVTAALETQLLLPPGNESKELGTWKQRKDKDTNSNNSRQRSVSPTRPPNPVNPPNPGRQDGADHW